MRRYFTLLGLLLFVVFGWGLIAFETEGAEGAFGAGRTVGADAATVGVIALAVSGIVFVGTDFFRGGIHHDLSRFE